MLGSRTAKKPRTIRRRLLAIAISVVSILVGLYILTNQTFVASAIQPYIGSALGAPEPPRTVSSRTDLSRTSSTRSGSA